MRWLRIGRGPRQPEAPRAAWTPEATKEQDARRFVAEAMALYQRGALRRAVSKFQEALAIWRGVGDRAGEGATLNNRSDVCQQMGRLQEELAHY